MVWNTTQSARYNAQCCCERKAPRAEKRRSEEARPDEPRSDASRRSTAPKSHGGLFDDGDTLLLLVLLYILVREKCDQNMITALLIAMLM